MKAGWVYAFNQSCMHGVVNDKGALRVHIVFDYYINEFIIYNILFPALKQEGVGAAT